MDTSTISGELICKYFHVMLTIGSSQALSYKDLENEYLGNYNNIPSCNVPSVQEAQGLQRYWNKKILNFLTDKKCCIFMTNSV